MQFLRHFETFMQLLGYSGQLLGHSYDILRFYAAAWISWVVAKALQCSKVF